MAFRLVPVGLLAVLVAVPVPLAVRSPGRPPVPSLSQSPIPQRDQPPPTQQPTARRIPVGTASISGSVTASDTGRPIRGARVMVNGNTLPAAARAGGLSPLPAQAGAPASARSQGPGAPMQPPGGAATGRASAAGGAPSGIIVTTTASRSAVTDDQGNFTIDRLPAGQYALNVTGPRNTFLAFSYGQKKPNGPAAPFPLTDGQRARVTVQMIRGGVIMGTVFGEDGDPLGSSQVRAWRYSMNGGVRRLQTTGFATTDDRGMYRLFGLQPGDYLISVTPDQSALQSFNLQGADETLIAQAIASGAVTPPAGPGLPATVTIPIRTPQQQIEQRQADGPPPGYLPVYYPNSSMPAGATVVHITGGDERAGIDIQARLVQATNIQGTVGNPPGEGATVQLSLMNDDPISENTVSTRPDNNGHFTFRTVAPGKYTILAQVVQVVGAPTFVNGAGAAPNPQPPRQLDDSQKWWGRTLVSVDGQPNITADVTLKPGRTISGRVVFEMERPPDLTRQRVNVTLSQASGTQGGMFSAPSPAAVGPDGTFTLKGVIPGKYTLRAQAGLGKSAMVNGQDVLDFPLNFTGDRDVTDAVLTVTDKFSEVSGTLTDAAGKPAVDYMIVAAAADERFWIPGSRRIVVARPSPDGLYMLRGLPPGDYLLAAVTDLENGGQYDPEFLKSLVAAAPMRVSVVEGGKLAQDLRVAR